MSPWVKDALRLPCQTRGMTGSRTGEPLHEPEEMTATSAPQKPAGGEEAAISVADIARRYFDALAAKVPDAQLEHYAPDGVGHIHGALGPTGPHGMAAYFRKLYAAFPDVRWTTEEITADGDLATVRWRLTGTFTGPGRFEGLKPNGARVDARGVDLVRVRDGKIVYVDGYTDHASVARQLGAMPAAGSFAERLLKRLLNLTAERRRIRAQR